MRTKTASYRTEQITANKTIRRDLFSCIAFQNVGTQNAYINNILILPNTSVEFNELHDTIIYTDFNITFDTDASKTNKLNCIITYYK